MLYYYNSSRLDWKVPDLLSRLYELLIAMIRLYKFESYSQVKLYISRKELLLAQSEN